MSAFDGSPAEMPIPSGQADWLSPDEATAERLLSGQGADPCVPADQRALALVLSAAARPATERELRGEQAAVVAFLAVVAPARRARTLPGIWNWARQGTAGRRVRRVPVLAAGGVLAVTLALSGTAATGMLPAPLQQMAHTVFGAPAPYASAPSPSEIGRSPRPANTPGRSPAASRPTHQKAGTTPTTGKAKGKAKNAAKAAAKARAKAKKAAAKAKKGAAKAAKAKTGNSNSNSNGNGKRQWEREQQRQRQRE